MLKTEQIPGETDRWLNAHSHIKTFKRDEQTYIVFKDTCTFLARYGHKYICTIYDQRPEECVRAACIKDTGMAEILIHLYSLKRNI